MEFDMVRTPAFERWLGRLRDNKARAVIARRIDRVATGDLGDVRSVGERVSELRVNSGPGYRIYFTRRGETLIVLLCGGDKDSQERDIARAKTLAQEI
jgi:putative addiction module killer protein